MKKLFFLVWIVGFVSCSGGTATSFDDFMDDADEDSSVDNLSRPDADTDVDNRRDDGMPRLDSDYSDEDIATENARWIAVGADGLVVTSQSGDDWKASTVGETEQVNRVRCNTGGECLSCGSDGGLYHSTDGFAWSKDPFVASTTLYSLFFGGEKWLAGGRKETLLTTTDDSWKRLYLTVENQEIAIGTIWQVMQCNTLWLMRGDSAIYHSNDLQIWYEWSVQDELVHTIPQGDVICLADNSLISGFNFYSTDGKEWQERPENELPSWDVRFEHAGIAQGQNGRVVISGFTMKEDSSLGEIFIVYSDDSGKSWQKSSIDSAFVESRHIVGSIATDGNGRWVCVTQSGDILLSIDNALSWELVQTGMGTMFHVTYRL